MRVRGAVLLRRSDEKIAEIIRMIDLAVCAIGLIWISAAQLSAAETVQTAPLWAIAQREPGLSRQIIIRAHDVTLINWRG